MSRPYLYRGKRVFIPDGAEITNAFRGRNGIFGGAVQRVLDGVEPWEKGEDPIETFDLPRQVGARVVALAGAETVVWGVNPHHTARNPGLSPFVRLDLDDERQSTASATLELGGTPDKPMLTRIYPGTYMPPLPWMKTAPKALPDGRETCAAYWSTHAFILRAANQPADMVEAPPAWYVPPTPPAQS